MNIDRLLELGYEKTIYQEQNDLVTYTYELDIDLFIKLYGEKFPNDEELKLIPISEDMPELSYREIFGKTVLLEYIPSMSLAQWTTIAEKEDEDGTLFFDFDEFYENKEIKEAEDVVKLMELMI